MLLVGATSSCLDKLPESAIPEGEAMQTFEDAEQILTGIYAGLKSSSLFSGTLTVMPDIQADLAYAVEDFSNTYGPAWLWNILSTDTDVESVYAGLYAIISRCNFFLERIGQVKQQETDVDNLTYLDFYTGEVYTIRALCYSKLIECFCKAYDPDTAENELGVVLRSKYSEPEPMKRASLKASYEFVLEDLRHAEELLDNDYDSYNSLYATAAAAQALHARVALYMQDFQTAIDYASKVIDNKAGIKLTDVSVISGSTTYLAYMWAYDWGTEIIWQIGYTSTSYGGALGQVFLNINRDYQHYYPDYVPAQWVLDAYATDYDLRYSTYFQEVPTGYANGLTWPVLVKYFGNQELIAADKLYMYASIPPTSRPPARTLPPCARNDTAEGPAPSPSAPTTGSKPSPRSACASSTWRDSASTTSNAGTWDSSARPSRARSPKAARSRSKPMTPGSYGPSRATNSKPPVQKSNPTRATTNAFNDFKDLYPI